MTDLPVIDAAALAQAEHGAWCPKLCNHACPVLAATGRNEAVPWGFHRTLTDLAEGRVSPAGAQRHLADCTGCLACQVPCTFDQDVPAQVRAGRAAVAEAGAPVAALADARSAIDAGNSPYGVLAPTLPTRPEAAAVVTVVVGCRDDQAAVDGVAALLSAAGLAAGFVAPEGCCGATFRDLGDPTEAQTGAARLATGLDGMVVATDPHCLPQLGPEARHVLCLLDDLLEAGDLAFAPGPAGEVTYHDPCLLARGAAPVLEEPRRLLRAAGYTLVEPQAHAAHTACSGAGMSYELIDPQASEAVAVRRRHQLATGTAIATGCSGARTRLADGTTPVRDLCAMLADRLPRTTP